MFCFVFALSCQLGRATSFQIQERVFAQELAAREQVVAREEQMAELRHRAETAECLAAEAAMLLEMERLARANHIAELERRELVRKPPSSLSSELDIQAAAVLAELAKQERGVEINAEVHSEAGGAAKCLAAAEREKGDGVGVEQSGAEIYI